MKALTCKASYTLRGGLRENYTMEALLIKEIYIYICVMCHVSPVMCQLSYEITFSFYFLEKFADLVNGGSVINESQSSLGY